MPSSRRHAKNRNEPQHTAALSGTQLSSELSSPSSGSAR